MKRIIKVAILTLFLGITEQYNAQIETTTTTINDNELVITMDKRIGSVLRELEENCKYNPNKKGSIANNSVKTNIPPKTTNNKPLTTAEICKQNPRILGYKIQVAVVKSKEEADKIRMDFRSKFPNIKVEVDASLRPNYKILAGSYFTKESAAPELKKVKASFGSATSVQYRVFCVEAK